MNWHNTNIKLFTRSHCVIYHYKNPVTKDVAWRSWCADWFSMLS